VDVRQRFVNRVDIIEAEGASRVLGGNRTAGFVVALLLALGVAALRLGVRAEVAAARCGAAWRRAAAVEGPRRAAETGRPRRKAAARARPGGVTAGPRPAGSAILAGARFADRQRPAVVRLSVELLNRLFGVRAIDEFDEREPAGPSGFAINRQHDLRRRRDRAEVAAQVGFSGAVSKITNEQTDGQSTVS